MAAGFISWVGAGSDREILQDLPSRPYRETPPRLPLFSTVLPVPIAASADFESRCGPGN